MSGRSWEAAQATLTVDLDALDANWRLLAGRAAPARCGAVVKADAYGIAIETAVPSLARAGCRTFFVAHLGEGIRARMALRAAGFAEHETIVYLLHGLQPGLSIEPALADYNLRPVLGSFPELEVWIAAGSRPCAVQIDTGMNRIGIDHRRLGDLRGDAIAGSGVELVFSHFVAAEEPENPLNARQIERFDAACERFFPGVPRSLANSSGHFLPYMSAYDVTRPGYAIYGGNPCPGRTNPMRPVIRLDAAILQTREIAIGETVGYNGRWRAGRPTRLATIGVGYADGVPRGADTLGGSQGPVAFVRDVPCPWVGRISMDLSILDITDAPADATHPGAPVELIGPNMPVDDFGLRCGTIGYEILTSLGSRYNRVYVRNEERTEQTH